MQNQGGRAGIRSNGQGHPVSEASGWCSSSPLDETDVEILSALRDRPMTILSLVERMDMSFVEGLARARKLWRMGLLERTGVDDEEVGLYRYSASESTAKKNRFLME